MSYEITVKNKLFFQQQFNINENIQSNTNFCYGLGWNMELGFKDFQFLSDELNIGIKYIKELIN